MADVQENLEKDRRFYKKLNDLNGKEEFEALFDLALQTVGQKMFYAFTSDQIKNWEDFCKVKGEVYGLLYPLQEVRSAEAMQQQLTEQLKNFYSQQ